LGSKRGRKFQGGGLGAKEITRVKNYKDEKDAKTVSEKQNLSARSRAKKVDSEGTQCPSADRPLGKKKKIR